MSSIAQQSVSVGALAFKKAKRNEGGSHPGAIHVLLYAFIVLLTCGWVLSLPIIPSQDEPLHLYYVHIFNELLRGNHTGVTGFYAIRHLLPPYATYYYGLVGLGRLVPLETADKLLFLASLVLFAWAGYTLVRAVAPASRWAPFLLLPVLLNWPSFMGFANYMLSLDLACFALAAWCVGIKAPGLRYSVLFLTLVALMVVTHPLPWMFTLGFAAVELAVRFLRRKDYPHGVERVGAFERGESFEMGGSSGIRRDLITLVLGCLPYFYLARFKAKTQPMLQRGFDASRGAWVELKPPPLPVRLLHHVTGLLDLHGILVFTGSGWALLYRVAIGGLLAGLLLLGAWDFVSHRRATLRLAHIWLLFAGLLALTIMVVPDHFAGGYYFTTRLQLLLYLSAVLGGSEALRWMPRVAAGCALVASLVSLFTLVLAARYITPAAQSIMAFRTLPAVDTHGKAGLLLRPLGDNLPSHLSFNAFHWAPVHYMRWNNLLLYNTAWLGDPLIPIGLRPEALPYVDESFYNQAPAFGDVPLADDTMARAVLGKVDLVLTQKEAIPSTQSPFAEQVGSSIPGNFASGWRCATSPGNSWYLCQPQR